MEKFREAFTRLVLLLDLEETRIGAKERYKRLIECITLIVDELIPR